MKFKLLFIIIFIFGIHLNAIAQDHYEEILRYQNGGIKSIITYNSNDIKDGPTINYYKNGKLQSLISYENGNINGVIENYYPNGNLESLGIVSNNSYFGKFEYYYPNSKPKSTIYYNSGKPIQIVNCYDKKGNLLYCGPFNNGNGEIYIYDEKGVLIAKDHFKNGDYLRREIVN